MRHRELHRSEGISWLRAAVLGANDGIVSTANLVVGVAAANSSSHEILVAGVAGLVARALYGRGRIRFRQLPGRHRARRPAREQRELATQRPAEEKELAAIYVQRGLDPEPYGFHFGVHWRWLLPQESEHCSGPTFHEPRPECGSVRSR